MAGNSEILQILHGMKKAQRSVIFFKPGRLLCFGTVKNYSSTRDGITIELSCVMRKINPPEEGLSLEDCAFGNLEDWMSCQDTNFHKKTFQTAHYILQQNGNYHINSGRSLEIFLLCSSEEVLTLLTQNASEEVKKSQTSPLGRMSLGTNLNDYARA